jgi:hypothetical protein
MREFMQAVSNKAIRHLLMNYSMTSHAARHPEGPVGWILRDDGQLDLYSGKTRLIMGTKGELVTVSTFANHISEKLGITTKGISNFKILGKSFNKDIFQGQKVPAVNKSITLNNYSVIGPETKIISPAGPCEIINPVPLTKIFDERMIFEADKEDMNLLPANVEIFNLVKAAIGVK